METDSEAIRCRKRQHLGPRGQGLVGFSTADQLRGRLAAAPLQSSRNRRCQSPARAGAPSSVSTCFSTRARPRPISSAPLLIAPAITLASPDNGCDPSPPVAVCSRRSIVDRREPPARVVDLAVVELAYVQVERDARPSMAGEALNLCDVRTRPGVCVYGGFRLMNLEAFVAHRSDPDVARYQSWDSTYSMAEADRFLDSHAGWCSVNPESGSSWAVVDRKAARCTRIAPRELWPISRRPPRSVSHWLRQAGARAWRPRRSLPS